MIRAAIVLGAAVVAVALALALLAVGLIAGARALSRALEEPPR